MNKKDVMIISIPLVIVALLYLILPDQIPRQFGLNGEVRYASKEFIFIFAFIPFFNL